ncbi:MAG: cobalamin-dependent protein [Bacillota bacterium]
MTDNLISSAKKIPAVPLSAAEDYIAKKDLLVGDVNQALTEHPDLQLLIGNNPLPVLYDNHDNHALFMSNVFKLNDFAFMARVIFWVYRTYYQHGFSFDYFPVALKAWVKAIEKHLEYNNARALINIYQWIIDNHEEIIQASENVTEPPFYMNPGWKGLKESFQASLLAGNHRESLKIANEAVHKAEDLADFYLQVIQPSMYAIGTLWEKGNISVAQEHLASAIVTRVMASLYPRFILLEQTRGKSIVTAAPNEFHEIGPRMVADLLEINGWNVDYIGANVPAKDILDLVLKKNPFFLAISVGMPFNIESARDIIDTLKNNPSTRETKIMLGGHCLIENPQLKEKLGVDGYGSFAKDAVAVANEWWANNA